MINNKLRVLCGSALLGGMAAMSSPALAANDAMLELIEIMRQNGSISEEQYSVLKNAAQADAEKQEAIKQEVKEEVAEATKDMPKITTKEKFKVESQDGNFAWEIGGRVQADVAAYDNDTDNTGTATEIGSGHEIRRARLEMKGKLWKVWGLKLQADFAGNEVEIKDAFINYAGFKPASITVGHFKEPFSLEELTSSKYITFMERAAPNVFAPGRSMGVMVNGDVSDMVTLAGGVFGDGLESGGDADGTSYGITGRATFSPVHEDGRVIHLGAAGSYRNANQGNSLRLRERFESHVSSTRLVDTGSMSGVEDFTKYGLEAAGVWNRFSLQGEYIMNDVSRESAFGGDVDFDGYYVYGSFFLTDDFRPYDFADGSFDKVSPKSVVGKGGYGAWEVALRYSSLDLSDGMVTGGDQDIMTVGLNWYATKNIRFMANYVNVLDHTGGNFPGAEPAAFQARAQVFW